MDENERLRTCGQHPTLGDVTLQGSRACGRILSIRDLYRCADCQTAFCRDCLRRHFADETPEARAALRCAEEKAMMDEEAAAQPEESPHTSCHKRGHRLGYEMCDCDLPDEEEKP